MSILDPIFYRTLFYDFRPVISPSPQVAMLRVHEVIYQAMYRFIVDLTH
jgi:hypothetical protein